MEKLSLIPEGTNMEKVKFHGVAMGGKIYSLRRAKRMSQEQLVAVLNISPAAVSKWERNLSNPSIEMLWVLADFFECSIDELVGRTLVQVERVGAYDKKKIRLVVVETSPEVLELWFQAARHAKSLEDFTEKAVL